MDLLFTAAKLKSFIDGTNKKLNCSETFGVFLQGKCYCTSK